MRLIFLTASSEEAATLVRTLVHEQLVACGNILPGARSIYRWQGEMCDDTEAVIFLETATERVEAAMARIRELHSYDCPKIVVVDPATVDGAYFAWVRAQTSPS